MLSLKEMKYFLQLIEIDMDRNVSTFDTEYKNETHQRLTAMMKRYIYLSKANNEQNI